MGDIEQAAGFFDKGESFYGIDDLANCLEPLAIEQLRVLYVDDGDQV